MASQWFCKLTDGELGPLTTKQLVALVAEGKVRPADLVRKNDSGWVSAGRVKGLFSDASGTALGTGDGADSGIAAAAGAGPDASRATDLGPLQRGSVLGNYKILDALGQGGMGVVLKAQHVRMDRLVALKVLKRQATESPGAIQRFHQEVRAAARLVHPNIVTAYDADEVDGLHFLVMEYVNGENLADVLQKRGPLPVAEAVDYVVQAARGLAYAHSEGVVHRDVKPGNLLLDKRGTVKILDMGLASIQALPDSEETHSQPDVTQANQLLGTFDYMPPEQAENPHGVDHRADIYSLGCTLYRLLTGQLLYKGDTTLKKILAHRDKPIPSLTALRPDVPAEVERIFRRMVAKRPEERYQSMTSVVDELERATKPRDGFVPSLGQSAKASDSDPYKLTSLAEPSLEPPSGRLRAADEAPLRLATPDSTDEFGFQLAPPTEDDRYYWQCMGQEVGPFTLRQLRSKKLTPDDLVRPASSSEWRRASDIKGLL